MQRSLMVRIDEELRQKLLRLKEKTGNSYRYILDKAVNMLIEKEKDGDKHGN